MRNKMSALFSILIFLPYFAHAQIEIKDIPPCFDSIEFYPESTVKTIYQTKNNWVHGWAIEFNENGKASGIGKYKKNAKKGEWRYSDCSIIQYKNACHKVYPAPYCATASFPREIRFDALVNKHLKYKK